MAHSLAEFAKHITAAGVAVMMWEHEVLEKACVIVEEEAKHVIGTYDYGWPQLAESTQKQRASLGFEPNEPLLRTGDMRDSIEHTVNTWESAGYVGTNNKIAVYQELGTNRIPPRSFLGGAAQAKEGEIHEEVAKGLHLAIMAGMGMGLGVGPRYAIPHVHVGSLIESAGASAISDEAIRYVSRTLDPGTFFGTKKGAIRR